MSMAQAFAETYVEARARFGDACRLAGVPVQRHPNPAPAAVELTTEVARFGPARARRLLLIVSGVHGVETLAGSGCQVALAGGGAFADLPPDTAVLLVHALNCWGAEHLRRNTEGNVDLARNFIDFAAPLPERPEYEAIHAAVCCAERSGPQREHADGVIRSFIQGQGMPAYLQALMGGQYRHPDGFAFGGSAPVWSNRLLHSILAEHAAGVDELCAVEIHTGLGPYGHATAVTMHVDADLDRTRRWFGDTVQAPNEGRGSGPKTSHRVYGHTSAGYAAAAPQARLTAIVLEFGTLPPDESLPLLLDDHWLAHHGDVCSAEGRAIKQRLLRAHFPADAAWREAILGHGTRLVRRALHALAAA